MSVILFPNASTRINLTLNEAATGARLRFSGTATDLNAVMGGKNILQSNGRLAGDIFVTDFAAPTIYDAKDAPFLDLNHNGIADDYERRHRLTSQQIQAVNSLDNMTPLRKYEYYAKTGREIDPIRIDTDGDGIEDATEASIGTDPINYLNTPVHSFAETPYFFAQNEILSDPRLIVYWSFDVPSQEQMGRAPLALFNNTYIEPGPNGMALHLNNKSQGARAAPNNIFDDINNFTLFSLVNTADNRSRYVAYFTMPDDKIAIAMDFGSGLPACEATINGTTYRAQTHAWRAIADNWNHMILCERNADRLRVYLDGKMEDEEIVPTEPVKAYGTTRIGVQANTTNQFYGLIDSIALYNDTLNPSEVEHLFSIMYFGQDFDADGMGDQWEIKFGLSPRIPSDAMRDDDQDGLTNLQEYQYYLMTDRMIDPKSSDTDSDGYSDLAEKTYGTDPTESADYPGLAIDTTRDSDEDRMPDWWELKAGLPIRIADADKDNDNDGLTNLEEYSYYTRTGRTINPADSDSNDNGLKDGEELARGADPSSAPERTVWLNLPARFQIDLPRGAKIVSAKATIEGDARVTLSNQEDEWQYLAVGTVDISRLVKTDCQTHYCRSVIAVRKEKEASNLSRAVIRGIEAVYKLDPEETDPLPVCPSYPCTIPLTVRSTSAGNITISLSGATRCDAECQTSAMLHCGEEVACETGGRLLRKAPTPEDRIRGAPVETKTILSRLKIQLIVIGAVATGLTAALIHVFLSRRKMRSPEGISRTREAYIDNARSYITCQTDKGQSIEHATARLIESGWPAEYVEEAAKRMRR